MMFGNLGCTETKRILELLGKNDGQTAKAC